MRKIVTLSAVFFSVLAAAQGLPRFGTARFDEAIFGVAEPALPVPFMPLWATVTLAAALWAVAYLMRSKESRGDSISYGFIGCCQLPCVC